VRLNINNVFLCLYKEMNENNFTIYKINLPNTEKCYIGSTSNFNERCRLHKLKLNSKIKNYLIENKLTIDDLIFEVIETTTRELRYIQEQKFIEFYDTINNGFNTRYSLCNIQRKRKLHNERSKEYQQRVYATEEGKQKKRDYYQKNKERILRERKINYNKLKHNNNNNNNNEV